ncbi:MAG: transcription-repair coupling factor, partial [Prevotellaceae bacterium]|nr:transcription-repair coupling factor [Prevotellaceae bacterium]
MNTSELLRLLASHPEVGRLSKAIRKAPRKAVHLCGLQGSATALAFAAATDRTPARAPLLFVLDDADEAGYFYHDLTQMLGTERVLFFPSGYRRAIKYNQKDAANEILRTQVLTRIEQGGEGTAGLLVVTHPEALAEQVISQQQLADGTLTLRKGDAHDFAQLEERLAQMGFQRVDYVYEPGQFAIRGSIVDIYSFASESPCRLDFFGDDIDSIRTFDIQTQLSDGHLDEVTVIPELETAAADYVPVLDFFPPDTILVTRSIDYLCDKVRQVYDEGISRQALAADTDAVADTSIPHHRLAHPDDFSRQVAQRQHILLQRGREEDNNLSFDTAAQPVFHKNFDLVEEQCLRLIADGYRLVILADSGKQIERLQDIFATLDNGNGIAFDPVARTIHTGFIDHTLRLCLFTDHQIFDRFHKYNLRSDKARRGKVALTLKEIQQFEVGDYVVHIDHGIGRFGGLVRIPTGANAYQEMIKITYLNEDTVYVSIHALHKISKYKGKEGEMPRLNKLGTGAWERMKERVKSKVKDIARDLIRLYSQRMRETGFAFSHDSYLQHELEASFVYEDTPDQLKATQEVKADMERQQPMDRLVCGDVGFGKTEVAVRAAFKAACDGKQVAVLVPTTVLAYQHFQTFSNRLKNMPVHVDYLSRARTPKEQREILANLAEGRTDIIIGTHKLIGKGVQFKDLGLLIIDEEQKFGVSVKEKLRQMKTNVDTLTMTATPIPRTLQFSLMGARDMSVIQTPPPNRYPIQTEIHTFSADVIAEAVNFEMSRNGQVFFVNNRINNLPDLEAMIHRAVPDARICVGHGRMDPKELEQIVFDFMNHDYDVMLSTTIVENGIDVPNANTIIINSAHHYGLSDLHQMRGRVGRGNRKAFCYLLAPPLSALPDDSRRRLQAIANFSDLGSGLHIAMQDLDIRGAGNLLGAEQSGFIADLGYETYQKVLAEAMQELKHEQPEALSDVQQTTATAPALPLTATPTTWSETAIETDIPAFFPETFVPSNGERMSLYRELDGLTHQRQLDDYRRRLTDRFGTAPHEAEELMRIIQMKWVAQRLGIERLIMKQSRMICYFVSNNDSPYYQSETFGRIIHYASLHPRQCQLRDGEKRSFLIYNITTVEQALAV